MPRKFGFLGFVFLFLSSSVAYASGDFGCGLPRGSIVFRAYASCNSVPFLSPSNDTRLNLELLLIDSGKLTGNLNLSHQYPAQRGLDQLMVPFDFEDWELKEPGAPADNGNANSAADSNDYAEGEGSRCKSDGGGIAAFNKAVNAAAGLPKDDATILIAARGALVANCDAKTKPDWTPPQGVHSALGREFAGYIAGASAFYGGDFPAALSSFNSLKNSANPWLKETSRYMIGRAMLNSAQSKIFGEFGDLKLENVDKSNLKVTEDAFSTYLHDFPNGVYAASARGLLRRVYWLGGDQTKLAEAFDRALGDADKGINNVTVLELVQEADAKLLGSVDVEQIQSPRFLAIIDLMQMRAGDETLASSPANVSSVRASLEAQKARFVKDPALYDYLLAVFHVYIDSKPEEALALLPNSPGQRLSYMAFSQQILRVLAMDASHQSDAERKLLLQLLPLAKLPLESEQLQLALAMLEEHTGHVDRVFAAGSAIQDKAIRTILVEHTASAEMLRQRIKDPKEARDVADAGLYALLYKELTGGKYQAFQSDLALIPAHASEFLLPFAAAGEGKNGGYRCPSLKDVAAALQRDGNDARSLMCVGELVRLHGVHYEQDAEPPKTDLGGSDSLFPDINFSRMDNYLKVIANKQAEADSRAYALARAVRCYEPSGNSDCGTQKIPTGTRKEWFQILHKEYPDSAWAKSLKYYW
jgi:hypothetical protein